MEKTDPIIEFGQKLKELRKQKNLSQQNVASMLGYTPSHGQKLLSKWENGKSTPSICQLKQLCLIYETSADYLLGLESYVYKEKIQKIVKEFMDIPADYQKHALQLLSQLSEKDEEEHKY